MLRLSVVKSIGLFPAFCFSLWFKAGCAEEITVSYASLTAACMDHLVAIEKGLRIRGRIDGEDYPGRRRGRDPKAVEQFKKVYNMRDGNLV